MTDRYCGLAQSQVNSPQAPELHMLMYSGVSHKAPRESLTPSQDFTSLTDTAFEGRGPTGGVRHRPSALACLSRAHMRFCAELHAGHVATTATPGSKQKGAP
jgi:hypothetical protein